jgi:signal transduction histidine kinase
MIIIAVERKGISYVFATERGRFRQTGVEPIIVLLVFLSVVIVLSYLAIRRILKPVRLLSAGVEAVSRGDFDHRIPVGKKDELGELSESFNSMSVLIKDMLRSKEQLLLDASHELRSPLTRIKVAMEFLPEGKALESIAEDIGEIETMITELLESERLNAPHGGLAVREENIAVIVRETVRDFGARKPGIIIRDMPEVCTVNVDRARTGLVLKNILDNALKYSGEESAPVEISLIHGTPETVLEVADNGAGISPEDVPRVFEPFYRADRSRSRQTGGYGLGLSLCRKIMEAHGGSIGISSEPGKGTRVRLVFPARRRQ